LPKQAPTDRWRSGAGGVAGAAQPCSRLIRSFLNLCQINNKWLIKDAEIGHRLPFSAPIR
jgi:hypothetical protein